MSRSGYTDDCENLGLWRGTVSRAIAGKRGQAFLRELIEALDGMPEKILARGHLQAPGGEVCALGAVGVKRGIELGAISYDHDSLSDTFGIARALIKEIEFENDDGAPYWVEDTPELRWSRVRNWAAENLKA
jgi:hypothetical protein